MNQTLELNLADVTSAQFEKMHHALGLPRKTKPYRNYYNCDANDPDWNDLVEKGFAIKGGSWSDAKANFFVTFEASKLVYGKRMSKKYYDEL